MPLPKTPVGPVRLLNIGNLHGLIVRCPFSTIGRMRQTEFDLSPDSSWSPRAGVARLAQSLRVLRKAKGISHQHLVIVGGISRNSLRRLEAGVPGVTLETLFCYLFAVMPGASLEEALALSRKLAGSSTEASR